MSAYLANENILVQRKACWNDPYYSSQNYNYFKFWSSNKAYKHFVNFLFLLVFNSHVTLNKILFHFLLQKLYEDMKKRIETTTKVGRISKVIYQEHKGFSEWRWVASKRDHQTIVQVLPTFSLSHGMITCLSKLYSIPWLVTNS